MTVCAVPRLALGSLGRPAPGCAVCRGGRRLDHQGRPVRAGDQAVRPPLPTGRIIALDGEAGYQARLLSPGWHFGYWRWRYRVIRVPVTIVEPGEIALVVAADGAAIPPERVLARAVACDNFQDAEAFLRGGGERGRQLGFLTAGTYRINPALFEVVKAEKRRAARHGP